MSESTSTLLNAVEEVAFAKRVESGDLATKYLRI